MPRVPRNLLGNLFLHSMVQGINREFIFENTQDKEKYIQFMQEYYVRFSVDLIAYCIMDNHAHLLLYANETKQVSDFMREINARYARYYNKTRDRVGYVFRNRYKTKAIYSEQELLRCMKYIHMNPVKANLVQKEEQYSYSSYQSYQKGLISPKILNLIFHSKNNYLDQFYSIPYFNMELENEKIPLKILIKQFLQESGITFEQLSDNPYHIKRLMAYFITHRYSYSKTELAQILNISRSIFYKM